MFSKTLPFIVLLCLIKTARAQVPVDKYARQFQELVPFTNSYLDAFSHDFSANAGFSLNHGWLYAAPPGKAGDVRVSLIASSAFIPHSGGYLHTDQIYQGPNMEISGAAATMYGGKSSGSASFYLLDPATGNRLVNPMNGEYLKGDFALPDGIGTEVGVIPIMVPEVEAGVGFGTSIAVRFLPLSFKANKGKVSLSTYGLSIKHHLSRYIRSLLGSAVDLSLFASYMHDQLKYDPSNGDLLEISGNYFNSTGSQLNIAHQSNAFQMLIAGSYSTGSFFSFTAQTGASYQRSRLLSHGNLQINLSTPLISDMDIVTQIPDLVDLMEAGWAIHIGAGVLMGKGPFQTSVQYAYVNTHLLSVGLHYQFNISTKDARQ